MTTIITTTTLPVSSSSSLLEDILVFIFGTAIPLLYSGHMFVAEKLACAFHHPEVTMGLGLSLWVISTVSWFLLAERFLHTFNIIIKAILFLVVLYVISVAFLGVGSIF